MFKIENIEHTKSEGINYLICYRMSNNEKVRIYCEVVGFKSEFYIFLNYSASMQPSKSEISNAFVPERI